MPLAAENGTFGYRVRRPSEAVESVTDGLGGPSYKWVRDHGDRYSAAPMGFLKKPVDFFSGRWPGLPWGWSETTGVPHAGSNAFTATRLARARAAAELDTWR